MKAAVIGGTGGQGLALTLEEPENKDITFTKRLEPEQGKPQARFELATSSLPRTRSTG